MRICVCKCCLLTTIDIELTRKCAEALRDSQNPKLKRLFESRINAPDDYFEDECDALEKEMNKHAVSQEGTQE